MPKFKYVAETPDGEIVKGVHKAETPINVRTALFERDLRALEVNEHKGILQFEITKKKLPRHEVMHFSRHLAAFISAGVPILDALDIIREEASNVVLRNMLRDVRESLAGGQTLSGALEVHRDLLPSFYVDMVRSAELTGRLDYVLNQLSRYVQRDIEARKKIRSALTYPAVIMFMSVITVIVLTTFVLPRFRTFFASLDVELPLATRMLLASSDFLTQYWWALIGGFFLILFGSIAYFRTPRGRWTKDSIKLKLPIVGGVVRYAVIERFCRILASMVNAGVPLPDAMRIVAEGTGNVVYQRALDEAREAMLQGQGLSRPIANTQLFPASVTQMMRVGEDTGTLDDQLESAAHFYDQELDFKVKRLTDAFEPAVIIVMGLIVGFVAIALISAMYGIFKEAGTV